MDKFFEWLSWRLPRRLIYFAVIRAFSIASTDRYSDKEAATITAFQMLKSLEA